MWEEGGFTESGMQELSSEASVQQIWKGKEPQDKRTARIKTQKPRESPDGLVVRISGFHCHGLCSTSGHRTEIPQAKPPGKKRKKDLETQRT